MDCLSTSSLDCLSISSSTFSYPLKISSEKSYRPRIQKAIEKSNIDAKRVAYDPEKINLKLEKWQQKKKEAKMGNNMGQLKERTIDIS